MAPPDSDTARGLAVFDLDGTITYDDTLARYLALAVRAEPSRGLRAWRLVGPAARFLVDRDRGRLKGSVIGAVLGGASRDEIARLTTRFVGAVLRQHVRPPALEAIERHRRDGDRLVLLSASPDLYVPAIARALKFDECICSEVRWEGDRLDGTLVTENRRGNEKRRVVEALIARTGAATTAAYGNAASDLPHLRVVDAPLLVNASAGTRRAARTSGIPVADWH